MRNETQPTTPRGPGKFREVVPPPTTTNIHLDGESTTDEDDEDEDEDEPNDAASGAIDSASDSETIFAETGHLPDRDQLFNPGLQTFSKATSAPSTDRWADGNDDWSGDVEEQVLGERSLDTDAVDDLESVGGITGEPETESETETETESTKEAVSIAAVQNVDYGSMTDDDLHRRAEAFGVAGRYEMGRFKLIDAIRAAVQGS